MHAQTEVMQSLFKSKKKTSIYTGNNRKCRMQATGEAGRKRKGYIDNGRAGYDYGRLSAETSGRGERAEFSGVRGTEDAAADRNRRV